MHLIGASWNSNNHPFISGPSCSHLTQNSFSCETSRLFYLLCRFRVKNFVWWNICVSFLKILEIACLNLCFWKFWVLCYLTRYYSWNYIYVEASRNFDKRSWWDFVKDSRLCTFDEAIPSYPKIIIIPYLPHLLLQHQQHRQNLVIRKKGREILKFNLIGHPYEQSQNKCNKIRKKKLNHHQAFHGIMNEFVRIL